jgi:HEAT repeats
MPPRVDLAQYGLQHASVLGRQLDLFSGRGLPGSDEVAARVEPARLVPSDLDDATLVAVLPEARLANCRALCEEAGRRRLTAAVPALEALCQRFKGFGVEHAVPEQIAALRGLVAIRTHEAGVAVARFITGNVVQGPALCEAVRAAAIIGCRLPPGFSLKLLRHNDPRVRAAACRCTQLHAEVIPLLLDLLDDLHGTVAFAAACALGRAGRIEARPMLTRLLREGPTAEVIDAVSSVADEVCIVQLGRIARTNAELSAAAIDALDAIDNPRAQAIAETLHGPA